MLKKSKVLPRHQGLVNHHIYNPVPTPLRQKTYQLGFLSLFQIFARTYSPISIRRFDVVSSPVKFTKLWPQKPGRPHQILLESTLDTLDLNLVGGWATPLKNDGVRQLG